MKDVRILHGELSPGNAMTAFSAAHPDAGGIVSFVGKVRPDKDVEELELKHYAPLTLAGMEEPLDDAARLCANQLVAMEVPVAAKTADSSQAAGS